MTDQKNDASVQLLSQAIKAARDSEAEFKRRLDMVEADQEDHCATWLRDCAQELMTSEALPREYASNILWAQAAVVTAETIWDEALFRARSKRGEG